MHNATIFKEQIQSTFKETYSKSLFIEGLKHKKELTLAEAINILSDESLLNEGLFGKMGGLVDKGVETVANKIVGAKDAIANWAITKLGGQVVKKPEPTPFDGASTILPIAKMAKDDQPGFFAKVAKMTGNTAEGIKELYMKLEDSYEKIPLIGKIASKVPKGWRTVILALIVIIVAGVIIYKEKTGQPQGTPAPTAQSAPSAPAPSAPSSAMADAATASVGKGASMGAKFVDFVTKNDIKIGSDAEASRKLATSALKVWDKLSTDEDKLGFLKSVGKIWKISGVNGVVDPLKNPEDWIEGLKATNRIM